MDKPVLEHQGMYLSTHLCFCFQLNADIYENDPELQKIREEKGYSYMDIIDVHPDKLPNYEDKVGRSKHLDSF